MKKCYVCEEEKELSCFGKNNGGHSKDGLTFMCLDCKRDGENSRYKQNDERKKYLLAKNQRASSRNRLGVYEYLEKHPCVDCGEKNIILLDFDHIGGNKKYEISRMIRTSYAWKTIMEEISKCEVVCSNCHRLRTAQRANWFIYDYVYSKA